VYDRRTLRQWAQGSDVIVVAQFRSGMQVWRAADGSDAQEFFTVRVLETVHGSLIADPRHSTRVPTDDVDFFPHAEGEPRWRPGDVAVLFFDRTAERAEFASLADRFPYFSAQGAGHEWTLTPATRDEIIDIVRGWVTLPTPAAAASVRTLLLRELRSSHESLQADGLAELVYARPQRSLFPDGAAVEPFTQLTADGPLSTPRRVALARTLDGLPGFDAGAALQRITEQPLTPPERTALIRSAGMTNDARLGAWLVTLLDDKDPLVRREAVAALGHPWHGSHIGSLMRTATRDDEPVALAAVRAIASIDSPEAQAALADLGHADRPAVAHAARAYRKQASRTPRRQP
jgi:hypothetical protein